MFKISWIIFFLSYNRFVGKPTMTPEAVWNRFSRPGGSTRHLHHFCRCVWKVYYVGDASLMMLWTRNADKAPAAQIMNERRVHLKMWRSCLLRRRWCFGHKMRIKHLLRRWWTNDAYIIGTRESLSASMRCFIHILRGWNRLDWEQ